MNRDRRNPLKTVMMWTRRHGTLSTEAASFDSIIGYGTGWKEAVPEDIVLAQSYLGKYNLKKAEQMLSFSTAVTGLRLNRI